MTSAEYLSWVVYIGYGPPYHTIILHTDLPTIL